MLHVVKTVDTIGSFIDKLYLRSIENPVQSAYRFVSQNNFEVVCTSFFHFCSPLFLRKAGHVKSLLVSPCVSYENSKGRFQEQTFVFVQNVRPYIEKFSGHVYISNHNVSSGSLKIAECADHYAKKK